jgi:nitrate/nitrite-specific signal transduction histidine kinase
VRDDGRGIDEGAADECARGGHFGLVGMGERAARIGAQLAVGRCEPSGTQVRLVVCAATAYADTTVGTFERLRRRWRKESA